MLIYIYDENGSPIGVKHRNKNFAAEQLETYLFGKNLQGDIIAIYNTSGTAIVKYVYDAWGNIISTSGTQATGIGAKNSLRYRGYYYDTETGLYYLRARYYDPVTGRFISADDRLSTGGDLSGMNLYAYCGNNPVNRIDPYGNSFIAIAGLSLLIIGVVFGTSGDTNNKDGYVDSKKMPPPETGYKPPKKKPNPEKVPNPNGQGNGWPAMDGGVWIPDNNQDGGPGWVVQYPDGSHEHRYPSGHVRRHRKIETSNAIVGSIVVIGAGISIGWVLANDCTVVGTLDDFTLPVLIETFKEGVKMIFG